MNEIGGRSLGLTLHHGLRCIVSRVSGQLAYFGRVQVVGGFRLALGCDELYINAFAERTAAVAGRDAHDFRLI